VTPNGSLSGLSSEDLRAVVRAVLRDVLPGALAEAPAAVRPAPHEDVSIRSDAELQAFVRYVASLCEDPAARAELRDGRRSFRLAAGGSPSAPTAAQAGRRSPPGYGGPVLRIERGAVTERAVTRAAADGARLVLGPRAVLTPLARDKARTLGVEIEKER
jgi:hypothetical protein